jgi:predicted metalloprotease
MAIGGGLGIGGVLLLLVLSALTGQNPTDFINVGTSGTEVPGPATAEDDEQSQFMRVILKSTEDVWGEVFGQAGHRYDAPVLVLFSDATQSGCGVGQAAMGPFYCPADRKVYLDLSFFRELDQRFGAPGDFAQAYVVAHEVGHHVQTITGLSGEVGALQQRGSRQQANALSVRQELQADCLAGVWGHYASRQGMLEPGDAEEGLQAAAAIGDDRLQRETQGRIVPESFTHGSSQQRVEWLRRGLESGQLDACDTFQR